MSRIGKKPIVIPDKVSVTVDGDVVVVNGNKGSLKQQLHPSVKVAVIDKEVQITVNNPEDNKERALWGLFRSLINNMVLGVSIGFEKKLEINGIGYKAAIQGKKLVLNVGFSHPVDFSVPVGIDCKVEQNIITLSGVDKQLVGEAAATIRKIKKPEPYGGKGIKYIEEVIRRKAGKTAGKGDK